MRKDGDVNKRNTTGMSLTTLLRNKFTPENLDLVYTQMIKQIGDEDPDVSFRAIKLFLERFTIAADKAVEVQMNSTQLSDRESYNKLVAEALEEFRQLTKDD